MYVLVKVSVFSTMVACQPFSLQLLEKCYRKLIILVIFASFLSIFVAKNQVLQGYFTESSISVVVPLDHNYANITCIPNVTSGAGQRMSSQAHSIHSYKKWSY